MKTPQRNVLFVSIGWAEKYDGKHTIAGSHQDIKYQAGNPLTLGEGRAFLRDGEGRVQCVVGMGRIRPDSSIDVVFVAHNPSTRRHEIVGIYFQPAFEYNYWTNPKGRRRTWADASTRHFTELLDDDRPATKWPPPQGMRRWVSRWGTIQFPDLFEQYVDLI